MKDSSQAKGGTVVKESDIVPKLLDARRKINRLDAPEAQQKFAREAFDEAAITTVDGALMSGDPEVLRSLRNDNEEYLRLRSQTKAGMEPADLIDRAARLEASVGHVANWLVGSTLVEPTGRAAAVAGGLKESMGNGSWQALRSSVFARLLALPSEEADTPKTARETANDISGFVNGRGRSLSAILYSMEERDLMLRFANTMRLMTDQEGYAVDTAQRVLAPIAMSLMRRIGPADQQAPPPTQ